MQNTVLNLIQFQFNENKSTISSFLYLTTTMILIVGGCYFFISNYKESSSALDLYVEDVIITEGAKKAAENVPNIVIPSIRFGQYFVEYIKTFFS